MLGLVKAPKNSECMISYSTINNIIEYHEHFLLFEMAQVTPEYKIIKLVDFTPTHKCKEQLLVKGFKSVSKILNELVKVCRRLDMFEYIFQDKDDGTHPGNKSRHFGDNIYWQSLK